MGRPPASARGFPWEHFVTATATRRPIRLPAHPPEQAAAGDDQPDWGATRCLIGATATAALVGTPVGLLLGYWAGTGQMVSVPWTGLVQAHGQLQLFGWLGLSILGVTFHAMAHLFQTATPPARLTWIVLLLQLGGVGLRLVAPLAPWAAGAPGTVSAWLLLASSLALLGAFGVTMEAHLRTLPRRSPDRRAPTVLPKFLLSGLALWALALLVNLDGAIQAVRQGIAGAGALDVAHDALIVAMTGGGLAMIALGMSLRVVVGWLDLPAPNLRRAGQVWVPLLIGTLLRAFRPGVEALSPAAGAVLAVAGNVLWAGAVLWYLPILRGLWLPDAVRPGGGARGEADPPLAWFVRLAHAWLLAAAVLGVAEALIMVGDRLGTATWSATAAGDAARHALLFGFLGVLTAGLTGRLPTAFLEIGEVAVRATRHSYRLAWFALLVATMLRVAAPLVAPLRTPLLIGAGTAGSLGLLCLLWSLVAVGFLAAKRPSAVQPA